MDTLTFQSTFEKLYKKRTPRTRLLDLLINKYLEDPALSLVKNVKDIWEIWDRLKSAYGDPKSLLKNNCVKSANLQRCGKWKNQKNLWKVLEGLSRIINLMKDLTTLGVKHNIENQL